jgi:hypothetical protein
VFDLKQISSFDFLLEKIAKSFFIFFLAKILKREIFSTFRSEAFPVSVGLHERF